MYSFQRNIAQLLGHMKTKSPLRVQKENNPFFSFDSSPKTHQSITRPSFASLFLFSCINSIYLLYPGSLLLHILKILFFCSSYLLLIDTGMTKRHTWKMHNFLCFSSIVHLIKSIVSYIWKASFKLCVQECHRSLGFPTVASS